MSQQVFSNLTEGKLYTEFESDLLPAKTVLATSSNPADNSDLTITFPLDVAGNSTFTTDIAGNMTCVRPGLYHIDLQVVWNQTSLDGKRAVYVLKNNNPDTRFGHIRDIASNGGGGQSAFIQHASFIVHMALGDFISAYIYQNSAGTNPQLVGADNPQYATTCSWTKISGDK